MTTSPSKQRILILGDESYSLVTALLLAELQQFELVSLETAAMKFNELVEYKGALTRDIEDPAYTNKKQRMSKGEKHRNRKDRWRG